MSSKIIFFSEPNVSIASIRIRILKFIDYIPNAIITNDIQKISNNDIVIVHKTPNIDIVRIIKKNSRYIIWDICDNYFADHRKNIASNLIGLFDHIVCPTNLLKQEISKHTTQDISIIEDPVYYPFLKPSFLEEPHQLKLTWYGNSYNLFNADWENLIFKPLKNYANILPEINLSIVTEKLHIPIFSMAKKHNIKTKFVPWNLLSQQKETQTADLVILPINHNSDFTKTKSHNKLIDGIACGTMVLASPLESYILFKDYVFIGNNFIENIIYCIQNKKNVLDKIMNCQSYISSNFTANILSQKWISLCKDIGV